MVGECEVIQQECERSLLLATGRGDSSYGSERKQGDKKKKTKKSRKADGGGKQNNSKNSSKHKIYHKVWNPENLATAYRMVSGKKGANAEGIVKETLDSYSKQTIQEVSQALKDHSFNFKPIRRDYIPKPQGDERPLGIPSPRDKVVQKAAAIALDEIYEPLFKESSHGFRPKRGTHTALKQITG